MLDEDGRIVFKVKESISLKIKVIYDFFLNWKNRVIFKRFKDKIKEFRFYFKDFGECY